MKFFITGTTSGLGMSLQQQIESSSDHLVVLNRTKIDSKTIDQLVIDDLKNLNQLNFLLSSQLSFLEDVDVCIMNAGTLGSIKNAVEVKTSNILDAFYINCLANKLIVDFFLRKTNCNKFIYISSGASSKPYTGWLEYCSTKSFSDAMLRVYAKENLNKIFVSVSPGAIATKMQNQIRCSSMEEYPDMKKFVDLFDNNMLRSPFDAADQLLKRINNLTFEDSGSFIKI
jgi:benzil reductase ((S)-benzoin forming)